MKSKIFFLIIIMFCILVVIFKFVYDENIIPHRMYTNKDFKIDTYVSNVDKDEDGIDDQTDILEGVRNYIATKPKYKSKYYNTGYPDDNYGVCTDVVSNGLLNAGYDLKKLVYEDIKNNKSKYNITTIDKNIDFRRVRNLKVYFKNNAISLTTDIKKIEQWQGGDIIIFKKHIGIVSDKRNKNGIPFVIHHRSVFQLRYEEDILENRKDIVGHYRMS